MNRGAGLQSCGRRPRRPLRARIGPLRLSEEGVMGDPRRPGGLPQKWRPLNGPAGRSRIERQAKCPCAVLQVQSGRGAGGLHGAHPHRLQRRERHLRPDPLRRARGCLQGGLRRRTPVPARGRCGRYRYADTALRRLPPDPLGVLRRCGTGAIDPGTAGPAAKLAPLTMLETVGRAGATTGAVTTNVIGTLAEPCPAYIVRFAWYVPGVRFAGDASTRMVVLSIPLSGYNCSQPEPFV